MAKLTLQQTLDKSLKTAKQYVDTVLAGKLDASHANTTHLTLGTGSGNAYRGDHGLAAYNHSLAAHAPSNAQKNSDITKAEIEAKLTGAITSHKHNYVTMNDCNNTDFNTIKTAGFYYGYTGMTNAAVQNISVLEVIVYSTDWIVQRQTVINDNGKTYERHYYNGNTWSTWKSIYDSKNKPTPADIGALPTTGGTLTGDLTISKQGARLTYTNGTNSAWTGINIDGTQAGMYDAKNAKYIIAKNFSTGVVQVNNNSATATLLDASNNTVLPGSMTVGSKVTMKYNSTSESLDFIFI